MAEKIYSAFGSEIPARQPGISYKMKTDTDGKPCYVELNGADNAQRVADDIAWQASVNAPKPPSIEERLAKLEAKVKP
jgi:hypothetical protein